MLLLLCFFTNCAPISNGKEGESLFLSLFSLQRSFFFIKSVFFDSLKLISCRFFKSKISEKQGGFTAF